MHPYKGLPDTSFWRKAVVGVDPLDFDPVVAGRPLIGRTDPVMTAGSCFAQHIARSLKADGCTCLVTEEPDADERAQGVEPIYTARYGNIYSTLQMLQLFERAYGLRTPADRGWLRPDGRWVDPFRPNEFPAGFADREAVAAEQVRHLAAVRRGLETCSVFVFTLGLTEIWVCEQDGAAVPLAPGVVAAPVDGLDYRFRNLTPDAVAGALETFIGYLVEVNPAVQVVLTVSPVPLSATFDRAHVVTATSYSKAVLRVAAQQVADARPDRVTYFPSYEMVAAFPGTLPFADDLRSVRADVVSHVMTVFKRHFVDLGEAAQPAAPPPPRPIRTERPDRPTSLDALKGVVCDEEMLGRV